jgi:hypothetical protein
VVKINRTIISDTFDNGNGFFFHSTSFHNGGEPSEEDQEDFEHEFSNNGEVPELHEIEEDEVELVSSTTTTAAPTSTTEPEVVPRIDDDEAFNEILGDTKPSTTTARSTTSSSNKGIDDGLVNIEAVQ